MATTFSADPTSIPQCGTIHLTWSGSITYPARLEIYAQNGTSAWTSTPYLYDVQAADSPFTLSPAIPAGLTLWATLTDNTGAYFQIPTGCAITASTDDTCMNTAADGDLISMTTATQTVTTTAFGTNYMTTTVQQPVSTATITRISTVANLGRPQLPGASNCSNSVSYDSAGPANWTANSDQDDGTHRLRGSSNLPAILGGTLGSLLILAIGCIIFLLLLVQRIRKRQRAPLRPPMRRMFGDGSSTSVFSIPSMIHPHELTPQPSLTPMGETPHPPEFTVARSPTMRTFTGLSPGLLSPPLQQSTVRSSYENELSPFSDAFESRRDVESGSTASNGTLQPFSGFMSRLYATNASHQDSLNHVQ